MTNADSQDDQANAQPKRELAHPTMSELEDIRSTLIKLVGEMTKLLSIKNVMSMSGEELGKVTVQKISEAETLIQAYTDRAVTETAKAFGGCRICYGKGYSTVRHGETYHGRTHNMRNDIKYCTCSRGEQLEALTISVRDGGKDA